MEQWKPVPGWEDLYEVSDHGRVRSLDRIVNLTMRTRWGGVCEVSRRSRGRVLACAVSRSLGYPVVNLCKGGRKKLVPVGVLVLQAFVGPAPEGHECLHADDVKTNNHLGNLRWGTRRDNLLDRYRNQKKKGAKK